MPIIVIGEVVVTQLSDDIERTKAKLHARENSTLVFATVAASASLLILTLLLQAPEPSKIPWWTKYVGVLFSILGPLYRGFTIFTVDRIDYGKTERETYPPWATIPRMIIVRFFLYVPIAAWIILLLDPTLRMPTDPTSFWTTMILTGVAAAVFSVIEWRTTRVQTRSDLSEAEEKPGPTDAKKLADNAMHTRFTWAVIFLALIAGLAGLLPMMKPYESDWSLPFNIVLLIVYSTLTGFLSYSFYAICYTSFLLECLIDIFEKRSVKDFLKKYWSPSYLGFFRTKRNNEVKFRRNAVIAGSVVVAIFSMALFFLKYFVEAGFSFNLFN